MNPEHKSPTIGGHPSFRPPRPGLPVNVGAPIRPTMQGMPIRPINPPPVRPPGVPSPMRPVPSQINSNNAPSMMKQAISPPLTRPLPISPSAVSQGLPQLGEVTSSMQNMHIQQGNLPVNTPTPHSNKPRRVYAVNPEIMASTQPQQQYTQPQQQYPQQPFQQPQTQPYQQPHNPQKQPPWPNNLQPTIPASISQPLSQKQLPVQTPSPAPRHHHQSAAAGIGYTNAPYTHTRQQLPPELRPPENRSRIDPDQMPAPVQVREQDEHLFGNKYHSTIDKERLPLSTTQYIGLDEGNCNPRFMRSTLNHIPQSKEIKYVSKLPMGLVVAPLAKGLPEEEGIQVVQHGEDGPIRCTRCRAYINPWCVFTHGGSHFECNICNHSNVVPDWYFANIDISGRRIDSHERPELRYGSVEFDVPADYYSDRAPAPLRYVFALDVSVLSIQTGMLQSQRRGAKVANEIAIITFDKDVHFYNLSSSLGNAQMLVVSDIEEIFVPLKEGFFANPAESKDVICNLLDALPQMFKSTTRAESVYAVAIKGILQAMKSTGGQSFVFQTCLPNYGTDMLKPRDDKNLYGTEKEKTLLLPQNERYKELAKECANHGVCVNSWVFPTQYMDLATISTLSQLTGGDLRYYPSFEHNREKHRIVYQLNHDLHRNTGFDGVMRIRCSNGLQVLDHYGHCHMSTYTDINLAGIDEDKSIAAMLKHDGKLPVNKGISFQCALLYTTREGQRRVRVHNLQLPVTSQISDVFKFGDIDTAVTVIIRQTIFDLYHKNRKDIQKKLMDLCVDILTAYRVNCASSTSPGQLILPEAFKLLPVYIHSAVRTGILRGVGNDIHADSRVAAMSLFNSMTISETVWTLYPRMYAIHTLGDYGVPDERGDIQLPPMVRTSYERLDSQGAYLLDTGSDLYLWLGNNLSPECIHALFNTDSLEGIDPNMIVLPSLPTDLSTRVHHIMHKLQSQRNRYLAFHIVRQDKDALEFMFATWMCEDRNAEIQNYVDYMCVLHRRIQEEMKKLDN
ncbi:hypothetical protein BDB01DRAFT_772851 [Pilobolus umbonatus]|nr:hypothetical protein BDB01DRAFT_772851 [Pilobolus umbonatus]